jgi:hypothetical protein
VEHFLDAVGDSSVLWVRKTAQKVIFQIPNFPRVPESRVELELELIQTQMAQKPMLRAEVGMRVRCANKASAE